MGPDNRLFEYRIQYNAGAQVSAFDSYHYYMAENAEQAFEFHIQAMKKRGRPAQHLCVERKNPWNSKWEDVSEVIDHQPVKVEQPE